MIRSKTVGSCIYKLKDKKPNSISDFSKLNLGGAQKILSFGEYCAINKNASKEKKRKVISYFYKEVTKRNKV